YHLEVAHVQQRATPSAVELHHHLQRHDAAEVGLKEFKILFYQAVVRHIIDHKRNGSQLPDAIGGKNGKCDGYNIDRRAAMAYHLVDTTEKRAHDLKVQMAQMAFRRR